WSADGQQLATHASDGIKVWDLMKTTEFASRDHSGVKGFAWSRDGNRMATAGGGKVKIWDSSQRREIASWDQPADGVVWRPDGKRLALWTYHDKAVRVVDAATGTVELTFPHSGQKVEVAQPLDWSPDGTRLAFADGDSITVADVGAGKNVTSLHGHSGRVFTVRFCADGRLLASTAWDGTVRIWDLAAGKCLVTFRGHSPGKYIFGLAWSPDGKRIASGGWDQRIEVWDAESGKRLASLHGHAAPIWGLDWSPDGNRLASVSGDGTVKLWHTQIWEEVLSIDVGHMEGQVLWSPSGKQLAVQTGNTIKAWDAATVYEFAESPAYRLERTQLLARRERFDEARALLEKWLVEYPADKAYRAALARTYFDEGVGRLEGDDPQRAVAAFTEALRLEPGQGVCLARRAIAYNNLRESEKEITDLTALIRLDPKDAVTYRNRGRAYNDKGEYDKAIADSTEAIRLDPKNADTYNNRGLAHSNKGEYDKGIADYTEAIRLDPKCASAYSNRGGAYGYKGENDKAIADCNEAIRLSQAGAEAHLEEPHEIWSLLEAEVALVLAEVNWRLDHKDVAHRWYDQAVAWMDKNKGEAERLRHIRAEAAKLLGISEKVSSVKQQPEKPNDQKP
ncbi:MAG: tetratricopeptide repeat protein, partial [Thermoguttaceae bacterium]